jgi:hypothetical protein
MCMSYRCTVNLKMAGPLGTWSDVKVRRSNVKVTQCISIFACEWCLTSGNALQVSGGVWITCNVTETCSKM